MRIGLVLLFIQACSSIGLGSQAAPWPTRAWTRATPANVGMEPGPLNELDDLIEKGTRFPDIHSVLVVRHGFLVHESYFHGYDADDLHTLQSVSKSVMSALIGIAVDRGELEIDERVLSFFPEIEPRHLDGRKKAMCVVDLLTMRSGTDYREGFAGSPHSQLNRLRTGWTRFVLDRPMVREPGVHFQYDSGGVILLSAVLKSRGGLHGDGYAAKHLFAPLGIDRVLWSKNEEGHPHTAGGLHMNPRDMARFGLLYLKGGQWEGRQILSKEWVDKSFAMHVRFPKQRWNRSLGYGYLWWIMPPDPNDSEERNIYAACGFMGQYIFVVPAHDMVVVTTAGARGEGERNPIDFLYSHILPSVRLSQ